MRLRFRTDIIRYFGYNHLPEDVQEVAVRFYDQAMNIMDSVPESPERTKALRKLWEAKNETVLACAVKKYKTNL